MQRIFPSKRLGQNFLVDKGVVRKVIKTADLQQSDIVLEIGPGLGALTKELAKRVKKVIAVEKDWRMIEILKENLKEFRNVKIVQGDILKLNFQFLHPHTKIWCGGKISNFQSIFNDLISKQYKVVANLPFYITAPTIRKFLETENPPKEMVLIVQKEVAQRICPRPPTSSGRRPTSSSRRPKLKERRRGKTPRMNLLAVSVQFYSRPEIISYVSKKSFWPQPKVDAAIIKIVPHKKNEELKHEELSSSFFKIVKAGFSHPRKQLANNLSKELKLNKKELSSSLMGCGIKPSQRAETLTIDDWIKLTKVL